MKQKGESRKREKIISDKLFSFLWNEAINYEDRDKYVRELTSTTSNKRIDFYNEYGIKPEDAHSMLIEIYNCSHLTFKEIVTRAEKKKSEISNIFCIPIRTIEDWYSNKNKCPQYIRLMLLRYFYLIDLGKYMKTESEKEREKLKPVTYIKREKVKEERKQEERITKVIENKVVDKNDKKAVKESMEIQELLAKTDYLMEIIKRS